LTDESRYSPSNIPIPDPSLATAAGLKSLREEVKGWVDSLQVIHERAIQAGDDLLAEKIRGAEDKTANLDRVVQTRLAGSETALNAAMAAADKVTQEIKLNFGAIVNELKAGMTKQIDACNEKVEDLKKRVFESGGHSQGITQTATIIIAAVAALAAVVSVSIVISRTTDVHAAPQPPGILQHQQMPGI
jgi:hypothetical protein